MQENLYDLLFLLDIKSVVKILNYEPGDLIINFPSAISIFAKQMLLIFELLRKTIGKDKLSEVLHISKYLIASVNPSEKREGYCNICDIHSPNIRHHITHQHHLSVANTGLYMLKFYNLQYFMPREYRETFDHISTYKSNQQSSCIEENIYDTLFLLGTKIPNFTKEEILKKLNSEPGIFVRNLFGIFDTIFQPPLASKVLKYLRMQKYLIFLTKKVDYRGGYCTICDYHCYKIREHLFKIHNLNISNVNSYCKIFHDSKFDMPNKYRIHEKSVKENEDFLESSQYNRIEDAYDSLILFGIDKEKSLTNSISCNISMKYSGFSKQLALVFELIDKNSQLKLPQQFLKLIKKYDNRAGHCNICDQYFYKLKSHLIEEHKVNPEISGKYFEKFPVERFYFPFLGKESTPEIKAQCILNEKNSEEIVEVFQCSACKGSGKIIRKIKKIEIVDDYKQNRFVFCTGCQKHIKKNEYNNHVKFCNITIMIQ